MKKNLNKILILFIISAFAFSSCDELSNLPLNIPTEPIYFYSSGNNTSTIDDGIQCLSSSDDWYENVDDIESVQFIGASLWADSLTSPGLVGDLTLTVRENSANGPEIFTWSQSGVVASEYMENPLEITLDETEIESMNAYLNTYQNTGNLCFYGSLTTDNISDSDGAPFTIHFYVIMVVEATINTD